jgi:hypothetical protein
MSERPITQEREDLSRTQTLVSHSNSNHFLLNIHALHNAHQVQKYLSQAHIVQPRILSMEEPQIFCRAAAILTQTKHTQQKLAKALAAQTKKASNASQLLHVDAV